MPKQKGKIKCAKCGQPHKWGKLHKHKPTGSLRCKRCMTKYGNSQFIQTEELTQKKSIGVGKYTLSDIEIKDLWIDMMRRGISKTDAWRRIENLKNQLTWNRRMKKYRKKPKPDFKEEFAKLGKIS